VGFYLPLGFPVGQATLKAVLHASVNLFTILSSSCWSAQGTMRFVWSEKEYSSETAQFLTAPTSESDTKVRSMIAESREAEIY